jgi:hypothetical protein
MADAFHSGQRAKLPSRKASLTDIAVKIKLTHSVDAQILIEQKTFLEL